MHQMRSSTHESFVKSPYYKFLTPRLKMNLTFECLHDHYLKFYSFFNDLETGFKADRVFVRKIITNFFSSMHYAGEDLYEPG